MRPVERGVDLGGIQPRRVALQLRSIGREAVAVDPRNVPAGAANVVRSVGHIPVYAGGAEWTRSFSPSPATHKSFRASITTATNGATTATSPRAAVAIAARNSTGSATAAGTPSRRSP